MFDHVLYTNEHFVLVEEEKNIYIKVAKKGYNLADFQELNKCLPRIKMTQFVNLRSAIINGLEKFIVIGEYKEVVEVSVSKDRFTAYAIVNLTEEEFAAIDTNSIIDMIVKMAAEVGVTYGLDVLHLLDHMKVGELFVIAKGIEPVKGEDAVIRLYEIEDAKPEVFQDGKVNHYELNLINKVIEGDWLGERIEPTEGVPGRTVFGEIVPAISGKQEKLIYDRKTISAHLDEEKGITTLRAKRVGAVVYENGVLSVCNYLEIKGKVSFETGNIDFDGFVDVKEGVEDNFSVVADNDIQVMGQLGVGAVNSIESREGSIYVRGGIAGQGKATIVCDGDLFTKFASDCTIICKGTVHIGFYAMNCNIQAKEVLLEAMNSRIIGGNIEADIRVCAGEIGSRAETLTAIRIKGFNRQAMREEYDSLDQTLEKLKQMSQLLKQKIAIYQSADVQNMENKDVEALEQYESEYLRCQKSLKMYGQRKKNYVSYLHTKGDGEVSAFKCMFPNVRVQMGEDLIHLKEAKNLGTKMYLKDGRIHSDI
ncbi:MAG: DUF342 domain-containing protein [Vallitaleaceae bacterium]|nr:DUF342 domain-containing protein [Vallitaleaceae bacterium]